MEAPLQQRIVGAIVLVTLGVIFIPALLDGSGYKTRQAKDIVVQEKPKFPPLSQKVKLEPIPTPLDSKVDSKNKKSDQSASKSASISKPKVNKSTTATKPKVVAKEKITVAKTEPKIKPVSKVKPESKIKPESRIKPKSDKAETKKRIKSFAIQVGTFDSNENAEKVRNKLRKAGYTAFINKSKSKTKPSYRVRIGPELDYDVMEKLLVKLKKSEKMDGYIVNHPLVKVSIVNHYG